ncbi:PREDICTED: neural cell adhesion molecule 1-like [Priapulus caudatus]|uniref:Neural cell adhesion molecule 1-like n=1 Tax=Priapulus caudatus TaxID=37621 RepID=A0ABM1E448_PRICU|nr:PREDICTED: neural cell adhesion molecule 1-like [Priapulus caudatus]
MQTRTVLSCVLVLGLSLAALARDENSVQPSVQDGGAASSEEHFNTNLAEEIAESDGAAAQLELMPPQDEQYKNAGVAFFIDCRPTGDHSQVQSMYWTPEGSDTPVSTKTDDLIHVENDLMCDDCAALIFNSPDQSQAGRYTCHAVVDGNEMTTSFTLHIYEEISMSGAKTQDFEEGSDALIACTAEGNPIPIVEWQWTNKDENDGRFEQMDDGLLISGITRVDSGTYTCRGRVNEGKIMDLKTHIITVNVMYAPLFDEEEQEEEKMFAWVGKTVELTCAPDSHPTANFTWERNGFEMPELQDGTYLVDKTDGSTVVEVTINDQEDFGDYRCIARNAYGDASRSFMIEQAFVPGEPDSVDIMEDEVTPTSVSLRVEEPSDSGTLSVAAFTVEWVKDDAQWEDAQKRQYDLEAPIIVDGLQADTLYRFRVAAVNPVGMGAYSRELTHKTDAMPATDVPLHGQSVDDGPGGGAAAVAGSAALVAALTFALLA